jgi:hypothetical protein
VGLVTDDQFGEFLRRAARDYNAPPEPPREEMWAAISATRRASRAVPAAIEVIPIRRPTWLRTAIGIAAVLLIGIAIGRFSSRGRIDVAGRAAPVGRVAVSAEPGASPFRDTGSLSSAVGVPGQSQPVAGDPDGARQGSEVARMGERFAASRARDPRQPRSGGTYRAATLQHLVQAEVLLTSFRAEARGGAVDQQVAEWARDLLSTTRLLLDSPAAADPQLRRLLDDLEVLLAQIAQLPAQRGRGEADLIDEAVEQRDVITRLRTAIPAGRLSSGS